jgi:hypothetical protein
MQSVASKRYLGATAVALALNSGWARATVSSWTGSSSNAWELGANWSSGVFPNGAADTAVIDLPTNAPVQITSGITLGGSTSSSLTIGDNAAATGLHIANGGTLTLTGATAGITSDKIIALEGLLEATYSPYVPPHHAPPPLSIYPVTGAGSITLLGGTINGTGTKGAWGIDVPITGSGTLANRVYLSSTVTVDDGATMNITGGVVLQGGTLAAQGSGFYNNAGSIGGYGTIAAPLNPGGQIPNSGGVTSLLSDISGGCRIGHETETDVGSITLTGTSAAHINFDNDSGPVNLIGDPVFSGYVDIGSNGPFNLNGHRITLTYGPGNAPPVVGIISAVTIGTGTIDNATATNLEFSQGPYTLAGGSLTSSGGGAFIRGGIYGWGVISAPIIPCGSAAIVSANSPGQALRILNSVVLTIPTINGNLIATNGGILELGQGSVVTTAGPSNFTGYISPGSGTVRLAGTHITGGSSPIRLNTGATNVTADSTVGGPIDCAATLAIDPGVALGISGGAASVSLSGGSLTNHGTLAIGAGLLTNAMAGMYSLNGDGVVTLAGGAIAGTAGFQSSNTLEGYGTVSAPFTNDGVLDANAAGGVLTMSGAGPGALVNAPTGVMEATGGGTLSFSSATSLTNQGSIVAGAASIVQALGGPLDVGTGTLSGAGTVETDVLDGAGTVSPGPSPATLTIQGSYTQNGGTLTIGIGGAGPGQFDALVVSGNAGLGGVLRVGLLSGFSPANGQTFDILSCGTRSGQFDTVDAPGFAVQYLPTGVRLVASACYANCDNSTTPPVLNVLDFSCFLNRFAAGDTYANCDQSTTPPVLNVLDFSCFLNQFAAGCP